MEPLSLTNNLWGGRDVEGPNGIARFTLEDGATEVLLFTPAQSMEWKVSISPGAPRAIFLSAWIAACVGAGCRVPDVP